MYHKWTGLFMWNHMIFIGLGPNTCEKPFYNCNGKCILGNEPCDNVCLRFPGKYNHKLPQYSHSPFLLLWTTIEWITTNKSSPTLTNFHMSHNFDFSTSFSHLSNFSPTSCQNLGLSWVKQNNIEKQFNWVVAVNWEGTQCWSFSLFT